MKTFARIALISAFSAASCLAQTATVVFYSPSISGKNFLKVYLPHSEQPFGGLRGGWLLDGTQRLARIRAGRFAIFHFNPGAHSFIDEGPTGPSKKPLVIDLKENGQYCVRLFVKMINLEVYGEWQNRIEEVPCQRAQSEAAYLKEIEPKRVEPAVSTEFVSAATVADAIHPPQ